VFVALLLGGSLTSEGNVTNNPESVRAADILEDVFPVEDEASELIVVRSEDLLMVDTAVQLSVEEVLAEAGDAVESAELWHESQNPTLVSEDRAALLVPVELTAPEEDSVEEFVAAVEAADERNEQLSFDVTGRYTTGADFTEVSQRDLEEGELRFGLPAALLVLVLVFGAFVAALLPLALAIVSIIVALGLTALVAQGWDLSVFVVNMLTGMGLALGIDYALFVVSRFREERAHGREKHDAIVKAGSTASRAVLFSGTAFVLAMTGLLLVQSTIMRSLAVGAILVGIVSVVGALTLLPALLSLLGDRVNRLRVPFLARDIERESAQESRFWGWIVQRVIRRPALSFGIAAGALLVAALPLLGMNIGAAGIATLPDELVSKQGLVALQQSFPRAGAEPARIVVQGDVASPEVQGAIERLEAELAEDAAFGEPVLDEAPDEGVAVVTVPVAADALSDQAIEAVERLRGEHVPAAFEGVDAEALVGGTTANNIDYFDVMKRWLPLVFVFVLGLSFILLTVAFRSVVIAATAILLNLLSIGATYGILVLVFQHGYGTDLLGFQQVDIIEAWVPLFLFAVLFGLSMDYQVFLLSRIRERYTQTGSTNDAIAFGIGSTARLITGAALIIVAVFAGFAMGDLVMFQQMGFGIAVALLLDATVVRSVLVPAAMTLLGDWNWYLPSWLQWLPHMEVEGHEN
jgi:putative drug exporter of the RND superfamily